MNLTKQRNIDIILSLALIGLACGVHLFFSGIIASLYILLVCVALFKTKNIFPYLALTIFIAGCPASFMFVKDFEIIPNVPFIMAFSLTLTLKYWSFRKMIINIYRYKKALELFVGFALLLIVIGLVLGIKIESGTGFGFMNYILIGRFLFLLPLIVLVPFLINDIKQLLRLLPLIETIILINFTFQLFYLTNGFHINEIFNNEVEILTESQDFMARAKTGWIYSFIYTPMLLVLKLFKRISVLRFFIGICLSIIGISFTGSRGYLLAILVLSFFSLFYLMKKKNIFKIIIISFIAIFFFPFIKDNDIIAGRIDLYDERFLSKNSTLSSDQLRENYGDIVLENFKESPLIGFGFSADGIEYYDQHSGNQSILLSGGLVGLFVYGILLCYILLIMFNSSKGFKKLFLLKCLILLSFFIIHSTSTDLFSPYFSLETYHYNKFILIAFIFTYLSLDRKGAITY